MKRSDLFVVGLTVAGFCVTVFLLQFRSWECSTVTQVQGTGEIAVGACGNATLTPTDSCTAGLAPTSCSSAQKTKPVKILVKVGVDSAGVDIMALVDSTVPDGCTGTPVSNIDACLNAGGSKINTSESGDQEVATDKSCNKRKQKVAICVSDSITNVCKPWIFFRRATCGGSWPQTKLKTGC